MQDGARIPIESFFHSKIFDFKYFYIFKEHFTTQKIKNHKIRPHTADWKPLLPLLSQSYMSYMRPVEVTIKQDYLFHLRGQN